MVPGGLHAIPGRVSHPMRRVTDFNTSKPAAAYGRPKRYPRLPPGAAGGGQLREALNESILDSSRPPVPDAALPVEKSQVERGNTQCFPGCEFESRQSAQSWSSHSRFIPLCALEFPCQTLISPLWNQRPREVQDGLIQSFLNLQIPIGTGAVFQLESAI